MSERHVGRDRQRLTATVTDLDVRRQRALHVALVGPRDTDRDVEMSLDELVKLTDTAGSDPVEVATQRRDHPEPATYMGKGKARELASLGKALDVDVVIVDGELSAGQQRNLQEIFGCDVVDRQALILDIFAQHATSRVGMTQVELAMLRYRLPRLRGQGTALSRQGGGIGTRGPGETQLETDRRRVLARISKLERNLQTLERGRTTRRKARTEAGLPQVALVGYTNSGKSSLLNALTDASVLVEDRLFSTLDTTIRRLELMSGRAALLSDTVGFVRKLPHELVEAFRSTLEEAAFADLLLHVVDASAFDALDQIGAVRETLREVGAAELPELLVLNKRDAADPVALTRLSALHPGAAVVSAKTGDGLPELRVVIEEAVVPPLVDVEALIPYDQGALLAEVYREGEVIAEEHDDVGTRIKARVPHGLADRLRS